MNPIKHPDAAEMARTAAGNFSYITVHDGSTGAWKRGRIIRWTWLLSEGTGFGAEQCAY